MLADKSIIVTGAGSGIGRATAMVLARAGAKVVAASHSAAHARETADMITAAGGVAKPFSADVMRESDVVAMVDFTLECFGRLDGAFNNAGITLHDRLVQDMDEAEWDQVMGVNLKGVYFCMKHETLAMGKTGGGAIVNNSSVNGLVGVPSASGYVASKHGVIGLTRGAACDAAATRVRVNAVLPGMIRTPMIAELVATPEFKAQYDVILARHSVGRIGEPEDVGYAVKWLLSDEASFINGAAICVDGGYSAR
ncbi:MAG: glucose 1-dehydrogenase [Rhodocyclaceae bacterium]|nr:glucose 1-dehydrogenase [Rhodocyclaceae bacterium]